MSGALSPNTVVVGRVAVIIFKSAENKFTVLVGFTSVSLGEMVIWQIYGVAYTGNRL